MMNEKSLLLSTQQWHAHAHIQECPACSTANQSAPLSILDYHGAVAGFDPGSEA
jgi:hypothetical protein